MNIHIPTPLRTYTGGLETVTVSGATVNAVFQQLTADYPDLKQHLFTPEGKLRSFVNVYLNDDDIRYLDWSQVAPLDLVILGDVLEHMTRAEAAQVVEKALTHGRIALISLPIVHAPQGEVAGNPFEAHVEEDWTDAEAKAAFPDWCVNILESYIGVYFLTRRAEDRRHLTERAQKFEMVLAREKNEFVKIHLPQRA